MLSSTKSNKSCPTKKRCSSACNITIILLQLSLPYSIKLLYIITSLSFLFLLRAITITSLRRKCASNDSNRAFKEIKNALKQHQIDYYKYLQTIRKQHALLHRNLIIVGRLTRERHRGSSHHCLHEGVTKIVARESLSCNNHLHQ